jgi:hypothetical protein
MPQLPSAMVSVPKPDVFPNEDSENWVPYTDDGMNIANAQPSRIRAIFLQISHLCEISNDILFVFYNPTPTADPQSVKLPTVKNLTKSNVDAEFKKLGELFNRLEGWRKALPSELDAKEGSLPSALLMHMFHQTLYIHLFRPFLKFSNQNNSASTPLSHLDPRKACLAAATTISKYVRFYKRRYRLRQICNVAGYFIHTACTIHLLNLPQKTATRDIVQGLKSLQEMGECWLVARRSLVVIEILVRRWGLSLPEEAEMILNCARPEAKRFGLQEKTSFSSSSSTASDAPSPSNSSESDIVMPERFSSMGTTMRLRTVHEQGSNPTAAQHSPPPRPPPSVQPMAQASSSQPQVQKQFTYNTSPLGISGIYAPPSPQGSVASVGTPTTMFGAAFPGAQEATHEWWLRDQAELGMDLAGLGNMGWEGGDVTGANGWMNGQMQWQWNNQ